MATIKVYPSPWRCVHGGKPCAVVPVEPTSDVDNPREFIGAELDKRRTRFISKRDKGEVRNSTQETRWKFLGLPDDEVTVEKLLSRRPVEVPDTTYYRRAIARGDLVKFGDDAKAKLEASIDPADARRIEARRKTLGTQEPEQVPPTQKPEQAPKEERKATSKVGKAS